MYSSSFYSAAGPLAGILAVVLLVSACGGAERQIAQPEVLSPSVTVSLMIVRSNVGRPPTGDGWRIVEPNEALIEVVSGDQEVIWSTAHEDQEQQDSLTLQERMISFIDNQARPQVIYIVFRPEVTADAWFPVLGTLISTVERTGRPLVMKADVIFVDGFLGIKDAAGPIDRAATRSSRI